MDPSTTPTTGTAPPGAASADPAAPSAPSENDEHIDPASLPPEEGRFERAMLRVRNWSFVIWGIYLVAVYGLPTAWDWTVRILDFLFWPVIQSLGRGWGVIVLAAAMAIISMAGQWLLTDVVRLREVKKRGKALRKEAYALKEGTPRDLALLKQASRADWRVGRAGMVPLAVFLGPMVAAFMWLPARIDPQKTNPEPGEKVVVAATVDGDFAGEIEAQISGGARLDETAGAATQTLVRGTAEQVAKWTVMTPAERAGVFEVQVRAAGGQANVRVATGDAGPPPLDLKSDGTERTATIAAGKDGGVIRSLAVEYTDGRRPEERIFWRPFAWMEWKWDAGWLGVYLVVYIVAMMGAKWVLRVP